MKNVLFLIPSFRVGGVEKVLINIVNALSERGHNVTIMNLTTGDNIMIKQLNSSVRYIEIYPRKNIFRSGIKDILFSKVRILNFTLWLMIRSPRYLYHQYIEDAYDVEIAFFIGYCVKIISGSTNEKSKKITWLHSEKMPDKDLSKGFISINQALQAYRKFDKIICVSRRVADIFTSCTNINRNVNVLNNLSLSKKIIEMSQETLNEINRRHFTIVSVGRFVKEKGFDRILEVVRRLNYEGINYDLWLIGDGKERSALENFKKVNHLDNVYFLGMQDNPYKFMKKADLYVCPSRIEGFSMVLSEALILGIPIVSTDCSGVDEMLDGGKYGIITYNDTVALYEGVKKVMSDPSLYKYYKKQAEIRGEFFNEDNMIPQIEGLFY